MKRFSLEDEYSGAIPGSVADQLETTRRANAQYKAVQAQVADDQTKSAVQGYLLSQQFVQWFPNG